MRPAVRGLGNGAWLRAVVCPDGPLRKGSACSYQVTVLTVGLSVLRPSRERHSIVAATDVRPKITLACQECKHRNYITKKNRRNDPDRLELSKYCPFCRKHQPHRETR